LTSGPYDKAVPSCSRDGHWIYFTSSRPDSEIWKIPVDGGQAVRVSNNLGVGPVEGEDGKSLYCFRGGAVWKSDLNGANENRIINVASFQEFRLRGKEVCFIDTANRSRSFHCD
jgi:Tol biopolymer transport system component